MANKPFHDRDGYIWMDGKMVPWREANVHFLTHGLHYATAVFEGERAYDGHIFRSRDHSERLVKSAEIIHLPMPFTVDQLEDAKREALEANNLANAYIRVLAWRGSEQMGIDPTLTLPHVGIAAWDWGKYFDPKLAETGISMGTSRWRKPSPDSAPIHSKASSLYNLNVIAKVEAQRAGYIEALMHDFEGYIAEATSSNLFAVKDGVLHTPIADRFLNGLTRQTVIQLAKDMGIEVVERRIKPEEIKDFDEIFLTGSAAELTAVGNIDGHHYQVGPLTRKLRDAYSAYARQAPANAKTKAAAG
jgi:branched-chain amino acid aminotransferase